MKFWECSTRSLNHSKKLSLIPIPHFTFSINKESKFSLNLYFCALNEDVSKNNHFSLCRIGTFLPNRDFALVGKQLSVYADVFTLYVGRFANARINKRIIFGDEKNLSMPSLGWKWIWSCTKKAKNYEFYNAIYYLGRKPWIAWLRPYKNLLLQFNVDSSLCDGLVCDEANFGNR